MLVPTLKLSDSRGLRLVWGFTFLASSHVMLLMVLVWVPPFEHHCLGIVIVLIKLGGPVARPWEGYFLFTTQSRTVSWCPAGSGMVQWLHGVILIIGKTVGHLRLLPWYHVMMIHKVDVPDAHIVTSVVTELFHWAWCDIIAHAAKLNESNE